MIGDEELAIIAGPCAIESREQAFAVAEAVSAAARASFAAGLSSHARLLTRFKAWVKKALKILAEVREAYGLKIVTEAIDESSVDLVERYGD